MDGVAYEDELDDKVAALRDDDGDVDELEVADYQLSRGYGSTGFGLGRRPRVAVLYAVGTIVSGRGGFDRPTARVGSESFVEEIRRIKKDSSIRAVVLRIDSPGGSSVASDVIWRELMLLRKDKPVAAAHRVDVGPRGVGRLLHRHARGRDRGAAGHADRLDRHLLRQVALGEGLAKVGVSTADRHDGRQRRHLLAVLAVHAGPARAHRRLDAGVLQGLRRQGGRVAQEDARGDRRHRARPCLDWFPGAGARPRGSAGRTGRGGDMAKERAGSRRATTWSSSFTRIAARSTRRSRISLAARRMAPAWPACGACWVAARRREPWPAPRRPCALFRRGEPLALMPFAFVR